MRPSRAKTPEVETSRERRKRTRWRLHCASEMLEQQMIWTGEGTEARVETMVGGGKEYKGKRAVLISYFQQRTL